MELKKTEIIYLYILWVALLALWRVVGCGEGVVYLKSPERPTDIGL